MGNSESLRRQHDWSSTAPSRAVIDGIAALEEVDPVALSLHQNTTLYDYVDPEALDTLATGDHSTTLSFTVDGYEIKIDGNTLTIHDD